MAKVKFIPNERAPSDAQKTQYNVFVDGKFTGYIYKDWMEYWWYVVDGKKSPGGGRSDLNTLFNIITDVHA